MYICMCICVISVCCLSRCIVMTAAGSSPPQRMGTTPRLARGRVSASTSTFRGTMWVTPRVVLEINYIVGTAQTHTEFYKCIPTIPIFIRLLFCQGYTIKPVLCCQGGNIKPVLCCQGNIT